MPNEKNKDVIQITIPLNVNFSSGLFVGITTGIGFHPIDKALYLRSVDTPKQHFFASKYWRNPMNGLRNTFYQRVLSSGTYFVLQGELNTHLYPILKNEYQWGDKIAKFSVGAAIGFTVGILSNANYAVKFYTFKKERGGPLENAIEMWGKGGIKPFFKGVKAGAGRDVIFGSCYETINAFSDQYVLNKNSENKKEQDIKYFLSRFFSAMIATTASSPFNYIRNKQFDSPPHKPQPHGLDLLCNSWIASNKVLKKIDSKEEKTKKLFQNKSLFPRIQFFQKEFMIGAGTLRAAAGMALGQGLFEKVKTYLTGLDETKQDKSSILAK